MARNGNAPLQFSLEVAPGTPGSTGFIDQHATPFGDGLELAPLNIVGAAFSEQFKIDEAVLGDYLADQSARLRTGIASLDGDMQGALGTPKKHTMGYMLGAAQAIESGSFLGQIVGDRGTRRGLAKRARGDNKNLEQVFTNAPNRAWVQDIFNTERQGFNRSPLLGMSTMSFYLAHAAEMHLDQEISSEELSIRIGATTSQELFGDAAHDETDVMQLSEALRRQGRIDSSTEALNGRIDAFLALGTVEIAALAVADTRTLGMLGGKKASKAAAIYRKYKDTLFDVEADAARDMLLEVASAFEDAAAKLPANHRTAKRVLEALAVRSGGVVNHMDRFATFLRRVYDAAGEPYHPGLSVEPFDETAQPDADQASAHAGSAAVGEVVEDRPALHQGAVETEEKAHDEAAPKEVSSATVAVAGLAEQTEQERLERAIFEQLDEIILPDESEGGTSSEAFETRLKEIAETAAQDEGAADVAVIWERLTDLVEIAKRYGGKLYKSKRGSLGTKQPYFVTAFEYQEARYAVAESPVYGHGTYVVSERHSAGTWLEVLQLRRDGARATGAISIRHSKKHPNGPQHRLKVYNTVEEFSWTKAF